MAIRRGGFDIDGNIAALTRLRRVHANNLQGRRHVDHGDDGDDSNSDRRHSELHDEIERLLIDAEREHINELFRTGKLKDEARRRIERELDLREAHIAAQQPEE